MESPTYSPTISISESRKKGSPLQVLQVHSDSVINHGDDYHREGMFVCNASATQTIRENWINSKQIDAVIVGTDCKMSDIISIKEITTERFVPLIFQSLKFDWKAKEIALETGVDEYHIGLLDERFIKRAKLIKRVKLMVAKSNKQLSDCGSIVKFWLPKRILDILLSTFIIAVLFPVLLIIFPILMLSTKGALFSSSKRVGMNYKIFDLYTFNYPTSEEKITGVWGFLQRMHLIRLPQVINVIQGDMSFIGNYPVSIQDAEMLTKDGIAWRFLVPAGIIGLWRIKADEWDSVTLDIEYAKTNSIWVDIRILFACFLNLLPLRKDKEMSQSVLFEDRITQPLV